MKIAVIVVAAMPLACLRYDSPDLTAPVAPTLVEAPSITSANPVVLSGTKERGSDVHYCTGTACCTGDGTTTVVAPSESTAWDLELILDPGETHLEFCARDRVQHVSNTVSHVVTLDDVSPVTPFGLPSGVYFSKKETPLLVWKGEDLPVGNLPGGTFVTAWQVVVEQVTPSSECETGPGSYSNTFDLSRSDVLAVGDGYQFELPVAVETGTTTARLCVDQYRWTVQSFDAAGNASDIATSLFYAGVPGDLNGDGRPDAVSAAPSDGDGRVLIAFGDSLDRFSDPANWATVEVPGSGTQFGASVRVVADLNGDALSELLVGARDSGDVYLFLGDPSWSGGQTIDQHAVRWDGTGSFGASFDARDVDRDGVPDVLIGNPTNAGTASLYWGDATWSTDNPVDAGAAAFTFTGTVAGGNLGQSVSILGDIDDDGLVEVLIGAPGASTNSGDAHVFSIDPSTPGARFDTDADTTLTNLPTVSDLRVGESSIGGVDLDSDTRPDFVVAGSGGGAGNAAGQVFVCYGVDATTVECCAIPNLNNQVGTGTSLAFVGSALAIGNPEFSNQAGLVQLVAAGGSRCVFDLPTESIGSGAERFGSALGGVDDFDQNGLLEVLVGAAAYDYTGLGGCTLNCSSGRAVLLEIDEALDPQTAQMLEVDPGVAGNEIELGAAVSGLTQ